MRHIIGKCLAAALLCLLAGTATAETRILSITADTGSPHTMPQDARMVVELLDVSLADAPARTLSSRRYPIPSLPLSLELPYDTAAINPKMTYVISARVESGGEVLMRTTTAYPVLTRGGTESAAISLDWTGPEPGPRISGVNWAAQEIGGRALIADDPPTIAFLEDGSFSMFGGCNRFRGKAVLSGNRFALDGPVAGTRRMCPDDRMKLEQDMLEALALAAGFQHDGSRLALTNAAGVVVLRLIDRPE